jgi:TIR domain/Pentapeptide repeats (8 copies)
MANPEHLAVLKQGVKQWNEWRQEHPEVRPDLLGADLHRLNLIEANLRDTDLRAADLSNADLNWVDLSLAKVGNADLTGADLLSGNLRAASFHHANMYAADCGGASFRLADLRGTNLSHANLREADLTSANMQGTNLSAAAAGGTHFTNVDLSTTEGLDALMHEGPSTVGIDTLYKSHGKIPEVFRRGCGVPDEFIAYIGSMVGRPIEFYSCFISYSSKDQEFADRLYADLQAKGVRCWFAPHDIVGGRKIHEQLDEAIRLHDKLLLILSEHSMASDWVGTEIANAREREAREKKQLLFPITIAPFEDVKKWKLFDADRGKDSAREIREYFIPDFSRWKEHDSYQAALEGLVKGLKASA